MEEQKVRLGGMALGNGLLVHGPGHWAAAVRDRKGEVTISSGEKPVFKIAHKVPGLRGLVRLIEAFAVIPLVKLKLPQAKMPIQDVRTTAPLLIVGVTTALFRKRRLGPTGELAHNMIGLSFILLAMRGSDLAAYHGVEHKAIHAYESDIDAAEGVKEHDRCGSNLVMPMFFTSTLGNYIRRKLGYEGPIPRTVVSIASTAASVEIFSWADRNKEKLLARALRKPGMLMQKLFVTREPDSSQLEVGRAAMDEILRLEKVT